MKITRINILLRDLIVIAYSVLMLFYEIISPFIVIVANIFFIFFMIISLCKEYSLIKSITLISVILIPTSTINLLVKDTNFYMTWFHLSIILLFICISLNGRINRDYFTYITCFGVVELILLFFLHDIYDGLKQYLMIILFLISFLIGDYLKKNNSLKLCNDITKYYKIGVYSFALQIYLQRLFILKTGIIIGHYSSMGGGRVAYAGLMGDYSFATLYLATGSLLLLLNFINSKRVNFIKLIIMESILIIAMMIISARTGIISLIVTFIFYLIFNIKKINIKAISIIVLSFIFVPYLLNLLMVSRGQTLLDSSGRLENYILSIKYWLKRPLFGYGLGLNNLKYYTGLQVPHNFFIQYLLQIGVIGTTLLVLPIIKFIKNDIKNNDFKKWVFWLVVIGSMFIPDIVSSRFLYGIVLISMTSNKLYPENRLYKFSANKNQRST